MTVGKDRSFRGKLRPDDIGYGEVEEAGRSAALRDVIQNAREYILKHLEDAEDWKGYDLATLVGAMVGDRDRYRAMYRAGWGRKVVSVAVAGVEQNVFTQCEVLIVALCDDGTLWCADNRGWKWEQMPVIPSTVGFPDKPRGGQ